jgi:cobalt-zinc-cadmium efflux system protein
LRHIIADLLGSVGVIAALVILLTDWLYADPIISVLIGFLVVGSSCKLLRDSTNHTAGAGPARYRRQRGWQEIRRRDAR